MSRKKIDLTRVFWLNLVLIQSVLAVSQSGSDWLTHPIEASTLGNGGAVTALSAEAQAIFYNPAGLSYIPLISGAFSFKRDLAGMPGQLNHLALGVNLKKFGVVGFSLQTYKYRTSNRTGVSGPSITGENQTLGYAIGLAWAQKVSRRGAWGLQFKLLHTQLDWGTDQGSAYTFNFDLGLVYRNLLSRWAIKRPRRESPARLRFISHRLPPGISWGMAVLNIGPAVRLLPTASAEYQPMTLRLGANYNFYDTDELGLVLMLDCQKRLVPHLKSTAAAPFYRSIFMAWADDPFKMELREMIYHFGLTATIQYLATLRLGFIYDEMGRFKTWTFGVGLGPETMQINLAYLPISFSPGYGPKSGSVYLTLTTAF